MKRVVFLATVVFVQMAQAQDTITFVWKGGVNKQFSLASNSDKLFTIHWGDGSFETKTGDGWGQTISHAYADTNNYTVNIIGNSMDFWSFSCAGGQLSYLDVSKSTALYGLGCSNNQLTSLDVSKNTALSNGLNCSNNQLTSLDVSKNIALQSLGCSNNKLNNLDLSKNTALRFLDCSNNQLNSLDVRQNAALQELHCYNNQLPLSELYAASGKVTTTNNKRLGLQFLPIRQIVIEDTMDFSSQAIFGGINTDFVVYNNYMSGIQATINVDYTINNGIIAFKKAGNYWVSMSNTSIKSNSLYPAIVIAEFAVREKNTDASLINLAVSEGKLIPVFHSDTLLYRVDVLYIISEITITAISTDTNATISGDIGMQQLNVGTNIFTITVTAEDKTTKRYYTVIANREDDVKITEIANYELQITGYEIFDVMGRNLTASLRGTQYRSNPVFIRHCGLDPQSPAINEILNQVQNDVLALPAGIYIIRMQTNQGIITKKIVKN